MFFREEVFSYEFTKPISTNATLRTSCLCFRMEYPRQMAMYVDQQITIVSNNHILLRLASKEKVDVAIVEGCSLVG